MSVKLGDKVSYKVGRGLGVGTVEKVEGETAFIKTAKGKLLPRQVSQLLPAQAK